MRITTTLAAAASIAVLSTSAFAGGMSDHGRNGTSTSRLQHDKYHRFGCTCSRSAVRSIRVLSRPNVYAFDLIWN